VRVPEVEPGETVSFSTSSETGTAYACPAEGNCVAMDHGKVTFDTYEHGGSASGLFTLNDGAVKGDFRATWCDISCTD
jgi:hypothetical protein